jgi:hypothetical protein
MRNARTRFVQTNAKLFDHLIQVPCIFTFSFRRLKPRRTDAKAWRSI